MCKITVGRMALLLYGRMIIRPYKRYRIPYGQMIIRPNAVWQRNYYEHITRNEQSYSQISEYIRTNPLKWQDDK